MLLDLSPILKHVPAWLLVLFRLTGIFLLAPMLGSNTIPRKVKALFAVSLSLVVYPVLLEPGHGSSATIQAVVDHGLGLWSLASHALVELLVGFTIGYAATLPLLGLQMGGQMMDQQLGIAFAGIVNPELNEQTGITGRILFLAGLTLFIIVGGHLAMLHILLKSFDQIPLGGFTNYHALVQLIIGLLHVSFELTLRVAAPILCLMFLMMTALGFIGRTVPQMNVLSVGFIIRILGGLACLVLAIAVGLGVYQQTMMEVMRRLAGFFAAVGG